MPPRPDPPARRILLADADAFYVAVARLVDPAGAGRARLLIVGGDARGRGVVTSASYEARQYGVHSAMPTARALRLCPDALVVPVPMEACVAKGREIRQALQQFTPAVEQASSDEFYLDMSGTERLYHDEPLAVTAARMRTAVRVATSLTVSIGGGTSKVIAKLAAGVAKPRVGDDTRTGVHIVNPGDELAFMRQFALADIHGIGPKFQERLAERGLRTVEDALRWDLPALTWSLGRNTANWLYHRVRGLDYAEVHAGRGARSISRDQTFARDITADSALAERLHRLVDRATSDLRHSGLRARTVTVRLRDADFKDRQASRTLPEPVSSERAVRTVCHELLARLRAARRTPARLIGVALSNLVPEDNPAQLPLLVAEKEGLQDTERDRSISRAMDKLREKFGRGAIARGPRGRRRK